MGLNRRERHLSYYETHSAISAATADSQSQRGRDTPSATTWCEVGNRVTTEAVAEATQRRPTTVTLSDADNASSKCVFSVIAIARIDS